MFNVLKGKGGRAGGAIADGAVFAKNIVFIVHLGEGAGLTAG